MTIPIFGLLVLITLLAIAATAVPLAKRLGQPATVLLAALGLLHGMATTILGFDAYEGALDSYDLWFVAQLALDSQAMLYVFLPPLLFEMTLAVSIRRLMEDATVVMTMAILAVATATAAVGLSIWLASPISLVACLLLGAAVATTDPGAVISTFREIGAPRRLLVILEGESLLNDAAAIAIFGLLIAILQETATPSVAGVLADFLYSFGSGAVIGLLAAALAGRIYPWLAGSTAAEASLTVVLAYGAYIGAEQAFGGSGVVAVVFAGLMTGTTG
ncbi:MAG: cation:proton antiporter, partial [Alphaproteobacteria bacterium]